MYQMCLHSGKNILIFRYFIFDSSVSNNRGLCDLGGSTVIQMLRRTYLQVAAAVLVGWCSWTAAVFHVVVLLVTVCVGRLV